MSSILDKRFAANAEVRAMNNRKSFPKSSTSWAAVVFFSFTHNFQKPTKLGDVAIDVFFQKEVHKHEIMNKERAVIASYSSCPGLPREWNEIQYGNWE